MVGRDAPGAMAVVMVEATEVAVQVLLAVVVVVAKALAVLRAVAELVEDEAKPEAAFVEEVWLEDERHLALLLVEHLVVDHWEVAEEVSVARLEVVPTSPQGQVLQG